MRGQSAFHGGKLVLADGELGPDTDGIAPLEPLRPEYWGGVREGDELPFTEGTRVVGHVTVTERRWPAAFTPATAAFVRAAYVFCEFVTKAGALPLRERVQSAREVLLSLYAAAIELPDASKATEKDAPTPPVPGDWPGFAAHDDYWEVFDPYVKSEPVAGWMSDAVLDVYRDIQRGLWFWENDEIADAVWEWRFSFDSHWGAHAIDALRALHRACSQT